VPSLKGSYFFWKSSFASAQINQVAASLAFATVLAIVPMLSIATILIGQLPQFVNFREGIQAWISVTLIPGGLSQSVSTYLDEFSTHSKGLTLFGVVGLIFSAFLTLMTIEKSFNQVWQVKRQRPFGVRLLIYVIVTVLGPILLGLSIYITTLLMSMTQGIDLGTQIHVELLNFILAFVFTSLPFIILYRFGPSAQVTWVDAFIGGVLAAIFFEAAKYGFTLFIAQVTVYKTLYGAFAILPLFLLWIYLTWWVTLAGAVLTARMPEIRASLRYRV
jgi:membrane protein